LIYDISSTPSTYPSFLFLSCTSHLSSLFFLTLSFQPCHTFFFASMHVLFHIFPHLHIPRFPVVGILLYLSPSLIHSLPNLVCRHIAHRTIDLCPVIIPHHIPRFGSFPNTAPSFFLLYFFFCLEPAPCKPTCKQNTLRTALLGRILARHYLFFFYSPINVSYPASLKRQLHITLLPFSWGFTTSHHTDYPYPLPFPFYLHVM